jgi:hypothetical protein
MRRAGLQWRRLHIGQTFIDFLAEGCHFVFGKFLLGDFEEDAFFPTDVVVEALAEISEQATPFFEIVGIAHGGNEGSHIEVVTTGALDGLVVVGDMPDESREQALAFRAEVGQETGGPECDEVGIEPGNPFVVRAGEFFRQTAGHHEAVVVVPGEPDEPLVALHVGEATTSRDKGSGIDAVGMGVFRNVPGRRMRRAVFARGKAAVGWVDTLCCPTMPGVLYAD